MFVLSNGEATLCELMYYNEDFYLGNINDKTIAEIWNSEKSRKISHPKQSDIVDTLNPCASCSSFEDCKAGIERKVCYVDVINVYGKDKYNYPDPRCPMAPQHNPDLMLY